MRGFFCLSNVRYWPIGDAQAHEIIVVREVASDPKRTVASQPIFRWLTAQIGHSELVYSDATP
jgi:hypothetical protein